MAIQNLPPVRKAGSAIPIAELVISLSIIVAIMASGL